VLTPFVPNRNLSLCSPNTVHRCIARQSKAAPPINVPTIVQQEKAPIMSDKRGKDRKGNRTLLDAYHPERYPRPDFNQWQAHTPTADQAPASSAADTSVAPAPTGPAAHNQIPAAQQPPAGNISKMDIDPSVGQSRWNQPASGPLPEAVAYFLSQLPPAEAFDGPIINAASFLDIVMNTALPPPPRPPIDDRPMRQSTPPSTGPGGPYRVSYVTVT
jgi:hypothetical protein